MVDLNDVAGPIATIIASIVAAYFASRQWKAAKLQAQIAIDRFHLDNFNLRHDVLVACQEVFALIDGHALKEEIKRSSLESYRHRIFKGKYFYNKTFRDILDEYLDNLYEVRRLHNKCATSTAISLDEGGNLQALREAKSHLNEKIKKIDLFFEKALEIKYISPDYTAFSGEAAGEISISMLSDYYRESLRRGRKIER